MRRKEHTKTFEKAVKEATEQVIKEIKAMLKPKPNKNKKR
jgi:hypothetical protein